MFTKDQIKQLQELFKAEGQHTREIVQEEIGKTEANVNKQFANVDKQFGNINEKFVNVDK